MNTCDYQDELLQRASEYYDPYEYVEEEQDALYVDDKVVDNFNWSEDK